MCFSGLELIYRLHKMWRCPSFSYWGDESRLVLIWLLLEVPHTEKSLSYQHLFQHKAVRAKGDVKLLVISSSRSRYRSSTMLRQTLSMTRGFRRNVSASSPFQSIALVLDSRLRDACSWQDQHNVSSTILLSAKLDQGHLPEKGFHFSGNTLAFETPHQWKCPRTSHLMILSFEV